MTWFHLGIEEKKKKKRNTFLVPIFRGFFQFGPCVLKSFNLVLVFSIHFHFWSLPLLHDGNCLPGTLNDDMAYKNK